MLRLVEVVGCEDLTMILSVKNLNFERKRERILDGISFELSEGSLTGLTGPNGAGKTTLFECLTGFIKASGGQIVFRNGTLPAYVRQHLAPKKSLPLCVKDFVKMGTWSRRQEMSPSLSFMEALEIFDLLPIEKSLISELSGGEWKRALLARVFVQPANLYFLDEPFNHLDLEMEKRLGDLLQNLASKKKKTFFVISHDWHALDHYFERVILINKKIIADGKPKEVGEISFNWRDPSHHEWYHTLP